MAAQYRVEFKREEADGTKTLVSEYVFASDDKAGYTKARKKAEQRLARNGQVGFKAVAVNCVG